jgi:hypothetical protein
MVPAANRKPKKRSKSLMRSLSRFPQIGTARLHAAPASAIVAVY